jgi:hypothetical protein
MKKYNNIFTTKWVWTFLMLVFVCFFLYFLLMRPWLMTFDSLGIDESISISPADTYTYWMHASDPFLLVPYNLMGPVALIMLFNGSFDLIFLFYLFLFLFVLIRIYKYLGINPFLFATLMLINPLIMFQFFAPNKEILIIISMLFIVVYIFSKKNFHLFCSLILSALSKPEFLVLVLFFLIARKLNKKLRPYILLTMIFALTLVYANLPNMESQSEILLRGQTSTSLGITVLLQDVASKYYLYPIVIFPRIFLTLFESSTIFILLSGICFFITFIKVISKLGFRLNLDDDIFFIGYLFIIMVSIVPFPHHRYILPLYPLLLIFLLRRNMFNNTINKKSMYHKVSLV